MKKEKKEDKMNKYREGERKRRKIRIEKNRMEKDEK